MADLWGEIRRRATASPAPRIGLGLAVLIIVLDQISKWLVLNVLHFSPPGCLEFQRASGVERIALPNTCGHIELSPVFDLTMVWNKGVSFGLFGADGPLGRFILVAFSIAVACLLIAGLLGYGPVKAARRLQAVAFGFIIGGAIGNAVDRTLYGAVVDFLNFSDVYFPYVFNIADVGINLGVAAVILDVLLNDRKDRAVR
ncbi:signal peptidase II [Maricaulis virginensis]|uniref:Lipoprotein signal peptidase n=1 Tax=Maricaulis virginensis TaxID=144022 RepID=A0A9W6IPD2_9PROT|nr:signal peptidase II [Maricaulis virginensis]GLK53768.1 lipoprotein signal peptidase [Maricaulis virginensis]